MSRANTGNIAFATSRAEIYLPEHDRSILDELDNRGWKAVPVIWNDETIDWARFDAVVIKSTWDYQRHIEAFKSWLEHVDECSQLINPLELIQRSMSKRYLYDKSNPFLIESRPVTNLESLPGRIDEAIQDWEQGVIIKPELGASAEGLRMVSRAVPTDIAEEYKDALPVILQPFIPSIRQDGEASLIYFDNVFSHAVRKVPAEGDIRSQYFHGGSEEVYKPSDTELDVSREAIRHMDAEEACYARVDLIQLDSTPKIIEIELVEPCLFLDMDKSATARFADAILSRI